MVKIEKTNRVSESQKREKKNQFLIWSRRNLSDLRFPSTGSDSLEPNSTVGLFLRFNCIIIRISLLIRGFISLQIRGKVSTFVAALVLFRRFRNGFQI